MTPDDASHHEVVHARACRGEGIPYRWVARGDEQVVEGRIGSGRSGAEHGAVALAAGAMAGGGDHEGDWKAAAGLAREAGLSMDEVKARASRYQSGTERESER